MYRRTVLLGIGTVGSLGLASARRRRRIQVRGKVFLTEPAAAYPAVGDLAADWMTHALADAGVDASVTVAEEPATVDATDDTHRRRVGWPLAVLSGAVGLGPVDPARDVNLLVTDGPVSGRTAGYAGHNVAAIAGARHLARMAPATDTPAEVDYAVPAAITQLLLHECGHALGLGHDHGTVVVDEDRATASPMVSGYAWAAEPVRTAQLDVEANACGEPLPAVGDERRRLALRYCPCAAGALRRYRGGLPV